MHYVSFLSVVVLAFLTSAASASYVNNGEFTSGAGGWTIANVDGAGGWRSSGGNPDGFFILNDNGSWSTDPTIKQEIAGLEIGRTYQVTGDYRFVHAGGSPTNAFGVEIDGLLWEFTPSAAWQSFSRSFVFTDESTLLRLTGERNGSDYSVGVDNIMITDITPDPDPSGVPLPASAMLGLPLMGVLALRRIRR